MLAFKILGKIVLGLFALYTLILIIRLLSWASIPEIFWLVFLAVWLIGLAALESIWLWRKRNLFPRLLTHLRYAPFFVFLFSILAVSAFDQGMILYSKHQIRQYVYGNLSPEEKPDFKLHNDYRGWCGNGYLAREYGLYNEVAAEGFESSDAQVRARSLQASIEVYDWMNGVYDGAFPSLIKRAQDDADTLVRKIAEEFREQRCGNKYCF
ncbi:MAG TPA: hypothetical protein VF571_07810 [Pyrinomonadaceae bacterium]|jgi:hypothetical protein